MQCYPDSPCDRGASCPDVRPVAPLTLSPSRFAVSLSMISTASDCETALVNPARAA